MCYRVLSTLSPSWPKARNYKLIHMSQEQPWKWWCLQLWNHRVVQWLHLIKCDKNKNKNDNMDVSKNRGTPKSSILIGFSLTNHLFWGTTIFGNTHINNNNPQSTMGPELLTKQVPQLETSTNQRRLFFLKSSKLQDVPTHEDQKRWRKPPGHLCINNKTCRSVDDCAGELLELSRQRRMSWPRFHRQATHLYIYRKT